MKTQILIFSILMSSQAVLAQNSCQNLFTLSQKILDRKALVEVDLSKLYAEEVSGKSIAEIADMNSKILESIESENPEAESSRRSVSVTESAAKRLLQLTLQNPIVTPGNAKYDQPNTSIGYCFGRATFIHLMLLKMGVQKDSIRKIWAVGPMKAGNIMWQFHVATSVFVDGKGWMVIDTNHNSPIPVREWMNNYSQQSSPAGMVRFYATDASKFAFQLGKYSRVQMGTNVTADKDWYRHYFKDMIDWLKQKEVSKDAMVKDVGSVKGDENNTNMTFSQLWASVIEFARDPL